tara:strand:+ start:418 stop:621 length:204 start_codon:yes stop_codon:yes gene_type:complete
VEFLVVAVVDQVMDQVVVLVVLVDQAVEELVQDQLILQEDQERQILVVAVELEKIQEDHQDQVVQEL